MNIIKLDNSEQTITSLELAEVTGKQHSHVMRDIRKMEEAWVRQAESKFGMGTYLDKNNQERPMYKLNKEECLYIATKYNDEIRSKLVLRWRELELKAYTIDFRDPDVIVEIVQKWADTDKKRIAAESKVRELQPKADLMQQVLDSDTLIDIGQAAKILELPFGRNTMFKQLREKGIFFKNRNEPMQEYIQRKLFVLKEKFITRKNHESFVVVKVLVTQRGLEFLSHVFGVVGSSKPSASIQ